MCISEPTSALLFTVAMQTKEPSREIYRTPLLFFRTVRENFSGVVAIQHLAYQSQIKITDLAGVLVYETESNGGEAVWNVKDLKGNRVNTGVYLVYATNADATDKLVGKIAVIK